MAKAFRSRLSSGGIPRVGLIPTREDRFLEVLGETGNVERAARAVAYKSTSSIRDRRNRDAEFARRWDEALVSAEKWLGEWMLARAMSAASEAPVPGDLATAPVSFREAMAFLESREKRRARQVNPATPLDADAARAELLKLVYAVKRAREEHGSEGA